MADAPHPASTTSIRETMARTAREKPAPPAAKRWLWIVVLGAGAAIALAQLLGLTSSPVEAKMRQGKPAPGAGTQGPDAPGR